MKNKLACIVVLTLILSITIYVFILHKKSRPRSEAISCQSQHTLIHSDFKLHANYAFTFGENQGELNISGTITDGKKHVQISRSIYFSYTQMNNNYILQSQHIEHLSADNSQNSDINHHFPSFFYEPGKSITFKIMNDNHNNKIIYLYNMPVYYCNNIA